MKCWDPASQTERNDFVSTIERKRISENKNCAQASLGCDIEGVCPIRLS